MGQATVTGNGGRAALAKRCLFCLVGMFFYATGVVLTKNCDLGISPITSVAYAMSLISGITLGWCTSIFNLFLFVAQKWMLGKDYTLKTLVGQAVMSVLFSLFIDGAGLLFGGVVPQSYPGRLILFVCGCLVLAFGMSMVILAEFVILPAEGTVLAIQKKSGLSLGNVKILFDAAMVLITVLLTLLCFRQVKGIREGTVLAVLLIGNFSKPIVRGLKNFLRPTESRDI